MSISLTTDEGTYLGGDYEVPSPLEVSGNSFNDGATVSVDSGAEADDTTLSSSTMSVQGTIDGVTLDGSSSLQFLNGSAANGTIALAGSGDELAFDPGSVPSANISGLDSTDVIDIATPAPASLTNVTADTATITYDVGGQPINLVLNIDGAANLGLTLQSPFGDLSQLFSAPAAPPTSPTFAIEEDVADNATIDPFATTQITDPDPNETESVSITLTDANGNDVADANGVFARAGFLTETAPGTYALAATDQATITQELQSLVFVPTAHEVAPGSTVVTGFTLAVTNAADGTTTDDAVQLTATAAETPPTISGTTDGQVTTDNTTTDPFSNVTITDPDNGALETVGIYYGAGNGTLSGSPDLTGDAGSYTLTGTPSVVTADLDSLVFTPTPYEVPPGQTVPTNFLLSVSDGIAPPVTDSTTTVTTTAAETPPAIAGTVADQSLTDNLTTDPFAATTLAEPDNGAAVTLTITLEDEGGVPIGTANGTLEGTGLTATQTPGTYTLSGDPSDVQSELQALVFTPTNHQVAPGNTVTTQFLLSATDGTDTTTDATTSVVAVAEPTVPVVGSIVATDDATPVDPFASVSATDLNSAPTDTITIVLENADGQPVGDADGVLTGGAFLSSSNPGEYVLAAGTPDQVTAELQSLVFTPTDHQVAVGQNVVTDFLVNIADNVSNDSTTRLFAVDAAAVPNGPAITGTRAGQQDSDASPIAPFATVTMTDTDPGAQDSVTLTLTDGNGVAVGDADGTLSGNGLTETAPGSGVYVLAPANPATISTELDNLVFTPAAHLVAPGQTVTTGFTMTYTDTHMTNPLTDDTTELVVTDADVQPTIGGTVAGQVSLDAEAVAPFASVTIGDQANATDRATVILSAATGTLSNLDGGTLSSDGLTYTVSGDPADVQAALRGLLYIPTASDVQPGPDTTTAFALTVGNSAGTAFDTTTTVISEARNESVPPNAAYLHGASDQYIIADNAGAMYVADSVTGRDGAQTLPPADNEVLFSDGVGLFDPTGSAENIARLYQAGLGREADVNGLEHFTGEVDGSGVSLATIANDLISSPEFVSRYGTVSNGTFLDQVYQNALDRAPDASGMQYWQGMLNAGMTRAQVLIDIADSPEGVSGSASYAGDKNTAEVYRLYEGILGRAPDANGSAFFTSALASGQTPTGVAQLLLNSAEYASASGQLSDSAFVTRLYADALGRAPAASDIQTWTGLLASGTSRAQVAVGISDSLEARIDTASATHDGWVFLRPATV